MRRFLPAALFAGLLLLSSCGPESYDPYGGSDLNVVSELFIGDGSLSEGFDEGSVLGLWNENESNAPLRLKKIQGGGRATFATGKAKMEGLNIVVSPFDEKNGTADDGCVSILTPGSHSFKDGELCTGIPMYGSTASNTVLLSPLCGLADIPLVGGGRIRSIQFTALDRGVFVTGRYLVNPSGPNPVLSARFEGEGRSVSIATQETIVLNYSDTTHVYIPLPEQDYGEYELAFEMEEGDPVILQIKDNPLSIARGSISAAAPVKIRDFQPLLSFCFGKDENERVKQDIPLSIDHQAHEIFVRIDEYVGLNGLKPSFTLAPGCKAFVNGAEQTSGVSAQNFYHPVTYTIEDAQGLSLEYTVRVSHFTGLPCVFIETPDGAEITSRDYWMEGVRMRIDGIGEYDDYETPSDDPENVKGRGNATWVKFPKKAFNMKMGKRAPLLGMPAHKRWCFIANYRDRTRLGNRLSYYIGSHLSGLDWTPRTRFIELFYNGEHRGMYLLTEQIRIDPQRVPVTEFEEDEDGNLLNVNEETVSGGYIFQLDNVFNEPFHFHTPIRNLPVEFKAPKENIPEIMYNYGYNLFSNLETLLSESRFDEAYPMMDLDSFVDFWIVAEVSGNQDATTPRSDFMHKDRGGPLKAGPIWDYDAFTYWRRNDLRMKNALWYRYLFLDPTFQQKVKEHWAANKPFLETIPAYIDEQVE